MSVVLSTRTTTIWDPNSTCSFQIFLGSINMSISWEEFQSAVTSNGFPVPRPDQYKAFVKFLPKGGITSKQEAAMALAHFIHESRGLTTLREEAHPRVYDVNGKSYYGRGYIQLTHEYNYRAASQDLYGDDRLLWDPDMVARDENVAWSTAFWFWGKYVHNRDGVSEGKFGVTTRAINGALECDGPNRHLAQRRFHIYQIVLSRFGLDPNTADPRDR